LRELIGKFSCVSGKSAQRAAPTALLLKKKTVVTVMESKENAAEGNVGDRQVKEIVEPTIAVPSEATVNVAIDEMAAQKADSAPVIDKESKLLGTVSREELNRKVGGLGHDPKSFPVEPEINKNNALCFGDQQIAEAEELMRNGKVEEVPVVNRDRVLIGKATLEKIKKEKKEKPKTET
jgi:CBS domain-containing protein